MSFHKRIVILMGVLVLCAARLVALAAAESGGKGAVLFIDGLDEALRTKLESEGFVVKSIVFGRSKLTRGYLEKFSVVVLSSLPRPADKYDVSIDGVALSLNYDGNIQALHEYVAAGGGLVFGHRNTGVGMANVDAWNVFLKRYGVAYGTGQLRHDAVSQGGYAEAEIVAGHPVTRDVSQLLYPINVLRWDDACSCQPIQCDSNWVVLARGKAGAAEYSVINGFSADRRGSVQAKPLSAGRDILAVRAYQKGRIAVCGINALYTVCAGYLPPGKKVGCSCGCTNHGTINGIVMEGEAYSKEGPDPKKTPAQQGAAPEARPSQFLKLFENLLGYLSQNSLQNGFGAGSQADPDVAVLPECGGKLVDWKAGGVPPPTWMHRVMPNPKDGTYDEGLDPLVKAVTHYKVLIGARTAFSSGSGTVAEYRAAAIKAGYSAIIFCEPFEDITQERYAELARLCTENSDSSFLCMPGLDVQDTPGNRYLLLGAKVFPKNEWLSDGGRRLRDVCKLTLGMGDQLACIHRPGRTPLHPKTYKHYSGITVFTYDRNGAMVDNGLYAYQWAIANDSQPMPIVVHEVQSPGDVATAMAKGYQQIIPAPDLALVGEYVQSAFAFYFYNPVRMYISEGPLLSGWSIFNKDAGGPEFNRDRYRLGVGVEATNRLRTVTLYDGLQIFRRWLPDGKAFQMMVDGYHSGQRQFMLMASDANGRSVISPQIRTTTRNYRLRCSDRQNWLAPVAACYIYQNWQQPPGYFDAPSQTYYERSDAPLHDYVLFSKHVQIIDTDNSHKLVRQDDANVGGDTAATPLITGKELSENHIRTIVYAPQKNNDLGVMLVETRLRLKNPVEPRGNNGGSAVYPAFAQVAKGGALLLPQGVQELLATQQIDRLPVGSYVGGIVPLTGGLRLSGSVVGFPAPDAATLQLPAGTTWAAKYLTIQGKPFNWLYRGQEKPFADKIPVIMNQMGFSGELPYAFRLKQGALERVAYLADFIAADGGVAGRFEKRNEVELLWDIPLRIAGVNDRCAAALWRSDRKELDFFDCFEGRGYVTLSSGKAVDFYAGNVAVCDPALCVEVISWDTQEAVFRVNNPTRQSIKTGFRTAKEIQGFKAVDRQIEIPAGSSIEVRG